MNLELETQKLDKAEVICFTLNSELGILDKEEVISLTLNLELEISRTQKLDKEEVHSRVELLTWNSKTWIRKKCTLSC